MPHIVPNGVMRDVKSCQARTLTHGLTYELATTSYASWWLSRLRCASWRRQRMSAWQTEREPSQL